MQKTRINTAIVALTAFVLMLTIASSPFTAVSFAAEDIYGNKMTYPVPAWKHEGPSPWYSCGQGNSRYNMSCTGYNPTSKAPNTPHVLWKHQAWEGGASGGNTPIWGFYEGSKYGMGRLDGGIMVGAGKVFYHNRMRYGATALRRTVRCLDEDTGEELWHVDEVSGVPFLRMYNTQYDAGCQLVYGTIYIDVETGRVLPRGTLPTGVLINTWNKTLYLGDPAYPPVGIVYCIETLGKPTYTYLHENKTVYAVAYSISERDPPKLLWRTRFPAGGAFELWGDYLVGWYYAVPALEWMGALNRHTGKLLWERTFAGLCGSSLGYGKIFVGGTDGNMYAFDLETGDLAWKTKLGATPYWSEHGSVCVGGGNIYVDNFSGYVYCLDAFTGTLKWAHYTGDCPYEPYKSWYGTWPYAQPPVGADGKVYAISGDHIMHDPAVPGERLTCFDGETGEILWEYPALEMADTIHPAIADGMLFIPDGYTGQIICFGKGPTAVEVSVPKPWIAKGEYMWITGKVTDQSPAQKDTPAVSKASMQAWMTYLHAGTPSPDKKTGVPVTLYAKGSDGTTTEIGTVTTDGDTGTFTTMWTPPEEDIYTITAVFSGDESYWDSWGSTELAVGPAASAASLSASSLTTTSMTIATIAAVVIGAIVIQKRTFKNRREETEK